MNKKEDIRRIAQTLSALKQQLQSLIEENPDTESQINTIAHNTLIHVKRSQKEFLIVKELIK